jgi:hypothetical protein
MAPSRYHITVAGRLSERFISGLDSLSTVGYDSAGTVLLSQVNDASALYGILQRLSGLGLELVRLERLDPGSAA